MFVRFFKQWQVDVGITKLIDNTVLFIHICKNEKKEKFAKKYQLPPMLKLLDPPPTSSSSVANPRFFLSFQPTTCSGGLG
jgi:hypothetical protein